MSFLKQYITMDRFLLLWGDFLLGLTVFCVMILVPVGHAADRLSPWVLSGYRVSAFMASILVCSFLVELYDCERRLPKGTTLLRVSASVLLSFFALSALHTLIPQTGSDRTLLLAALLLFGLLQWIWHIAYVSLQNLPGAKKRVLVLGTGKEARLLGERMEASGSKFELLGYVSGPGESREVSVQRTLGNADGIKELIRGTRPHILVVSFSERRGSLPVQDILTAKLNGVRVYDAPSFYERLNGKLLIEHTPPSWFIFCDGFRETRLLRIWKCVFDKGFALAGLLAFFPLMVCIGIAIKLASRGPVIFSQTRIGRHRKPFILHKFRTMVNDAERLSGPQWADENDPRITRIGKFLRKYRLDELPQLVNVLVGDLSIVGPRPERPEFTRQLERMIPYYSERHFVKPGITGWAQINYPYGASVEDAAEKLRYDLYYMKHNSIWLDVVIVLQTITVVLFGKGSR